MTEFNLSERIWETPNMTGVQIGEEVISKEDVKEFIKLLKEEIDFHMPKDIIIETIDKLAGDKLK